MKKTILLFVFASLSFTLPAQQPLSNVGEVLNLADVVRSKKVQPRSGDFYVVDSLYCYSTDPNSQVTTPVSRQYNLEFSEAGEALFAFTQNYFSSLVEWRNISATHSTYDPDGNLIEQRVETWDTLSQAWVNQQLTINTPNGNGDFINVLNREWHNGAWRNKDRVIISYDQNNLLQSLEQELWDTLTNAWKNNLIIYYAVNPNETIASTLFQIWDPAASVFKNISSTFHTYDPVFSEREIEQVAKIWVASPPSAGDWLNSSRTTKGYDPGGNPTEQIVQYWNTLDSTWLNQSRTLQNFNAADQVTLRTELTWDGAQWNNFFQTNYVYDPNANLTNFEVSQWQGNGWQALSECIFFWRFHHEVATTEIPPAAVCQFPNPMRPGDAIHCPSLPSGETFRLALFDLQGKMVFSKNVDNQSFTNIAADLPTGVYALTLSGKQGILLSQKIIIAP